MGSGSGEWGRRVGEATVERRAIHALGLLGGYTATGGSRERRDIRGFLRDKCSVFFDVFYLI